jgi:hypothetical protein
MNRLFSSQFSSLKLFLFSVSFLGIAALAGCGGAGVFPESTAVTAAPDEVPVGTIKGSNYGGHAPLVGAHIYLLQTGNSGYGSVTKGLLNATYSGSYATTQNPATGGDQFVPAADSAGNPYYYETADAYGQFNLTGDYTCTVGQPVYIVGYGGSPSFVGTGPNVFNLSGADTAYSDGTHAIFTYTVTSPLPELFYIGEGVAVTSFTGASTGFNISGTVADPGDTTKTVTVSGTKYAPILSTTQFSIYVSTSLPAGVYAPGSGTYTSAIATGTPAFNPAAVNMAMLGVCPSSGNFSTGASALQYVYMNEISTTAMAYAMNGYVPWGTNDQSGNDEFHIGAPNTTQAQQGIQNAAINAGNLYDIQHAAVSSTGDGEGHLARSATASGTGVVPQTLIDTIGNTLAACVDSNNTYRNGSGTQSPQCLRLDQYAQDNGYYDTTATTHYAFNIAQAAFNIAKYPQGMGTATTACGCYGGTQTYTAGTATTAAAFTSALYNLPTGNVPFAPNLSAAPNDFAVAINWQTSSVSGTGANTSLTGIDIDALGNVWTPANVVSKVFELSPSGTLSTYTPPAGSTVTLPNPGGIAIDTSSNVWVSAGLGTMKFVPGTATGTLVGGTASTGASQIAIDSAGSPGPYLYIANNNGAGSGNPFVTTQQLTKISSTTGAVQAGFPITVTSVTANTAGSCVWDMAYLTLDASNNIWTVSQNNTFSPEAEICRFTSAGVLQYALQVTPYSVTGLPHSVAIDAGGNAWFAEKDTPYVGKITAGLNATNNTGQTISSTTYAANLSSPRGVMIDGANTVWVSNNGNGSITQFSTADTALSPTYYTSAGSGQTDYAQIDVDISGNVWAVEGSGQLIEYVGAGTPTVQPLSLARSTGKLGAKP